MEFARAVTVKAISIHEVLRPTGLQKVSARAADGSWTALWETLPDIFLEDPQIVSPPIQVSLFYSLLSTFSAFAFGRNLATIIFISVTSTVNS